MMLLDAVLLGEGIDTTKVTSRLSVNDKLCHLLITERPMQANELKLLVIDALEDIKADQIEVLDVTAMTDFTDFMIIATGKSTRQVKALANEVTMQAKAAGVQPLGVEGEDVGEWALVDLGDVIAHIMTPQTRSTYNLEKLWQVPEDADKQASVED